MGRANLRTGARGRNVILNELTKRIARISVVGQGSERRILPVKEVSDRAPPQIGQSTLPKMFGTVVDEMAATTPARQVARTAVGSIVVAVAGSQDHPAKASGHCLQEVRMRGDPAKVIAPTRPLRVVPPTVEKLADLVPMPATTLLASTLRALEPHKVRDRGPVDRIEETMLGADRHAASLEQSANHENPLLLDFLARGPVGRENATFSSRVADLVGEPISRSRDHCPGTARSRPCVAQARPHSRVLRPELRPLAGPRT
jgi:hypothetical protein